MLLGGASAKSLRRELAVAVGGDDAVREGADTVLFLGDSWSDWAGEILEESQNCAEVNVVNKAVAGTTAAQWAAGKATLKFGGVDLPEIDLDIARFFEEAEKEAKAPVSRVWLSIGGNDLLGAENCTTNLDTLKENVAKTLDKIAAIDDSVQVLVTGYAAFSFFPAGTCTSNAQVESVNAEVLAFAGDYSDLDVTTVNVWDLFKTKGSGTESDVTFYQDNDPIHINDGGYKKLFAEDTVNDFMCQNTPDDTLLIVGLIGGVVAVFAVIIVLMFKK